MAPETVCKVCLSRFMRSSAARQTKFVKQASMLLEGEL